MRAGQNYARRPEMVDATVVAMTKLVMHVRH
jgi:hypothetical protein